MELQILLGIALASLILFMIFKIKSMTSPKGLEKKLTDLGNIAVKVQNNMINNNEEILKETTNKRADINKHAVRTMAHAVKEGFTEDLIYCKHCGVAIDSDSKFCKSCGKEQ